MIQLHGHCGDDGGRYCDMARGIRVARPFKNRMLGPLLVRGTSFVHVAVVTRFLVLDLVCCALALAVVWLLVRAVASDLGASARRANDLGIVAAAVLLLNPWMWHFIVSNPAMSDIIGLALGLGWILLFRSRHEPWSAAVLALLAVMAREAWFLPVLAIAVIDWRIWSRSTARAIANAGAALVGYAVVTLAPYAEAPGHAYSTFGAFRQWGKANFGSANGVLMLAWFFVFGLGLVPLLVLCARIDVLRRSWPSSAVVTPTGCSCRHRSCWSSSAWPSWRRSLGSIWSRPW